MESLKNVDFSREFGLFTVTISTLKNRIFLRFFLPDDVLFRGKKKALTDLCGFANVEVARKGFYFYMSALKKGALLRNNTKNSC